MGFWRAVKHVQKKKWWGVIALGDTTDQWGRGGGGLSLSRVLLFVTPWTVATSLCPWDFPGKITGVDCLFLLQGIFPTQGSNTGLLHCRQILKASNSFLNMHKPELCLFWCYSLFKHLQLLLDWELFYTWSFVFCLAHYRYLIKCWNYSGKPMFYW